MSDTAKPSDKGLSAARFTIMFAVWLIILSATMFGSWLGGWPATYWTVMFSGCFGFILGWRSDKGWTK